MIDIDCIYFECDFLVDQEILWCFWIDLDYLVVWFGFYVSFDVCFGGVFQECWIKNGWLMVIIGIVMVCVLLREFVWIWVDDDWIGQILLIFSFEVIFDGICFWVQYSGWQILFVVFCDLLCEVYY